MTHAKHAAWAALSGVLLAAAACSVSGSSSFDALGKPTTGSSSGGGADAASAAGDRGNTPSMSTAPQGTPTANGVVLLHAASFPSFRLCFQNHPELVPQPDAKVMPEANVVGVELGSVVRLDPLDPPGTIYVINESSVRASLDSPDEPKCGELLGTPKTNRTLTRDNEYHVIQKPITADLGKNHVQVLAITGCGSQAFLNALDNLTDGTNASSAQCGVGWNTTSGNLQAQIVDLNTTTNGATEATLPVQLFHMSSAIETFRGNGTLQVTFGPLSGGGAPVPTGTLYKGGDPISLPLDQSKPAVYGDTGFQISIVGGAAPFAVAQSLADIQSLSSPTELPTSYYLTASNYALLLLGDPSHLPTLVGGAANPEYNPRRAVHLLAVPVLDPTKVADAGADSGHDGG
jgi:hypothetical protein